MRVLHFYFRDKFVTVDCGATLGSIGLMRRVEEAEKKAKEFKGRFYKLD